jgi:hypothetical protein
LQSRVGQVFERRLSKAAPGKFSARLCIFSVKDSVRALAFEGDDHTDHDSMEVMLSQSCAPGD